MASPLDASAEGPAGAAREATFLFADIAGFTALTEAHGDEEAAALVAEFCRAVPSGRVGAAGRDPRFSPEAARYRVGSAAAP